MMLLSPKLTDIITTILVVIIIKKEGFIYETDNSY